MLAMPSSAEGCVFYQNYHTINCKQYHFIADFLCVFLSKKHYFGETWYTTKSPYKQAYYLSKQISTKIRKYVQQEYFVGRRTFFHENTHNFNKQNIKISKTSGEDFFEKMTLKMSRGAYDKCCTHISLISDNSIQDVK